MVTEILLSINAGLLCVIGTLVLHRLNRIDERLDRMVTGRECKARMEAVHDQLVVLANK